MKTTTFLNLMLAMAISSLYSCKGDTGPAGPAGTNGNANVSQTTFNVPASYWTVNGTYSWELDYTYSMSLPTNGTVEVFSSYDDINWTALSWVSAGNSPYFELSYTYSSSALYLAWYNITSGSTTPPTPGNPTYFKVVSIPSAAMKKHPNTNWHDYSQVNAILETQKVTQSN